MFNLGVDGDDAVVAQHSMAQQMQQYQNPIMEGEEEPSPRGEEHTPLISGLTASLLRTSFGIKALSMALMSLIFLGFGGRWVFTFHAHPEMNNGFHLSMAVLMALQLAGTLGLALFQAFVADDSKWTKGFRTGSKILSAAVTLDLLTVTLRLVQYLYLYSSLSTLWWSKFNVSKSEWTLFTASNLLDALAGISYGWALFYIEVYHDEGTFEELAWAMLGLFSLSGIFSLTVVFTGYGAVFMLIFTASAYAVACYWAFLFEPLLLKWSPELHSRDINTDIIPSDAQPHGLKCQQEYATEAPTQYLGPQTFGSMPIGMGRAADGQEIPTQYDYTQLPHQDSQRIEMGIVNPYR